MNTSTIPPLYANYSTVNNTTTSPSMPPSNRRSPSCSSGISSGSDPEYDSVMPETGMRYNVRSEGVFLYNSSSCIHKEETGSDRLSREYEHKGFAGTLHEHVLHHPHHGQDSTACPQQEAGCEWRGSGRNLMIHLDKNADDGFSQ